MGQVLDHGDPTEVILDWLLERRTHFEMHGRSYRTRHVKNDDMPHVASAE